MRKKKGKKASKGSKKLLVNLQRVQLTQHLSVNPPSPSSTLGTLASMGPRKLGSAHSLCFRRMPIQLGSGIELEKAGLATSKSS